MAGNVAWILHSLQIGYFTHAETQVQPPDKCPEADLAGRVGREGAGDGAGEEIRRQPPDDLQPQEPLGRAPAAVAQQGADGAGQRRGLGAAGRPGEGAGPEPGRHDAAGSALRGGHLPYRTAGSGRDRGTDEGGLSDRAQREPGGAGDEPSHAARAEDPAPAARPAGPPAPPDRPAQREDPQPDGAPRAAAAGARGSDHGGDEGQRRSFPIGDALELTTEQRPGAVRRDWRPMCWLGLAEGRKAKLSEAQAKTLCIHAMV